MGIAILDLEGNLISVKSFKEISKAEIIKHIISHGKAVIISTDVYSPPKMVRKLASTLNSKIDHPPRDMSVGSKIGLVESYLREKSSIDRSNIDRSKVISSELVPQNAHQRDALAAAISTYKRYGKKLEQIDIRTENMGLEKEQTESIKIRVIEGKAISNAIKMELDKIRTPKENIKISENNFKLTPGPNSPLEGKTLRINPREDPLKLKWKIKLQEKQIKNLKAKKTVLEADVEDYKDQIVTLKEKIDKLHYQYSQDILSKKEIASKISLIKKLQEEYNHEKTLRMNLESNLKSVKDLQNIPHQGLSKNAVPVKIIESFTKDGINSACEYWKIKRGDVVLLQSSKGGGSQTASLLINMGVKAVLIQDKMSHQAREEFEKNMVPLIPADHLNLKMIDQFALVETENLQDTINQWKTVIEKERMKESEEELLKVFHEYRAKRKRSSHNS